ncbi:hypothetical protein V8C42DRAFT_308075 [Trichoderma barbatum]
MAFVPRVPVAGPDRIRAERWPGLVSQTPGGWLQLLQISASRVLPARNCCSLAVSASICIDFWEFCWCLAGSAASLDNISSAMSGYTRLLCHVSSSSASRAAHPSLSLPRIDVVLPWISLYLSIPAIFINRSMPCATTSRKPPARRRKLQCRYCSAAAIICSRCLCFCR